MKKSESCIALDDVFFGARSEIVSRYIDELRDAFKRSDTMVLVARKALCFFYALEANGLLEWPQDCRLLSSRAIDYADIGDDLGHVIVVDDVMVSGRSLNNACEALEKHKLVGELLVAAISPEAASNGCFSMNVRAVGNIGQIQAYEFAREITKYVRLSGVSNNVDQPIIKVLFADENAKRCFFAQHEWTSLETPEQLERGIESKTLAFEHRVENNFAGIGVSEFGFMPKIRAISRKGSNEVALIPFVLIDELSYEAINAAFKSVMSEDANSLVDDSDVNCTERNKLRILQYVLARYLGEHFVRSLKDVNGYSVDARHELLLFGSDISGSTRIDSPLLTELVRSNTELAAAVRSVVLACAHEAYADLFRNGRKTAKRFYTPWFKSESLFMCTFDGLRHDILEDAVWRDKAPCADTLASGAVDILIDEGVFVPCPAISSNASDSSMVRAYRGGEIFELVEIEFHRFAKMLELYVERNGNISKETAMLLAPIFLRWPKIANSQISGAMSIWKHFIDFARDDSFCSDEHFELLTFLENIGLVHLQSTGNVVPEKDIESFSGGCIEWSAEQKFVRAFSAIRKGLKDQDKFKTLLRMMCISYAPGYAARFLEVPVNTLRGALDNSNGVLTPRVDNARAALEKRLEEATEQAKVVDALEKAAIASEVDVLDLLEWAFEGDAGSDVATARAEMQKLRPFIKHVRALAEDAKSLTPSTDRADFLRCFNHACAVAIELRQIGNMQSWAMGEYYYVVVEAKGEVTKCHHRSANEAWDARVRKCVSDADESAVLLCLPDDSLKLYSASAFYGDDRPVDVLPKRVADFVAQMGQFNDGDGPVLIVCSAEEGHVRRNYIDALLVRPCKRIVSRELAACAAMLEGYATKVYLLKAAPSEEAEALWKIKGDTSGINESLGNLIQEIAEQGVTAESIAAELDELDELVERNGEQKGAAIFFKRFERFASFTSDMITIGTATAPVIRSMLLCALSGGA